MKKLTAPSRILIGISALLMVITFFTPLWKIELVAPQYPEGLGMKIWLDNITGQVDIINGLNHYIGMKKISVASFPEFEYMPTIVGAFIALGLLVALIGRKAGLIIYVSVLIVGAAAGLYDYYQWSYDYGHNLDPTAPIQVPGLTYQPPLIGYKDLLNFQAFSFPDIGGWIFAASGLIAVGVLIYEQFARKDVSVKNNTFRKEYSTPLAAIFMFCLLSSCSSGPQAIDYGKDDCQHCRMTIMDDRFGSELINKNGKAYKFDDIGCMIQFTKAGNIKSEDINKMYVVDFIKTKELMPVKDATFLIGDGIKAPMGSNLAAFEKNQELGKVKDQLLAKTITWEEIQSKY